MAYNESGELRAGMGVAAGDYDGDGRIDLLVTNFYEEAQHALPQRRPAAGSRSRPPRPGSLAPSRSKLGFGTGFLDDDNDGRLDLFVANGHVNDVRPLGMPYAMSPAALPQRRASGRFARRLGRRRPLLSQAVAGRRAAAFGDLDNDGDVDIVVTHLGRPPAVLINGTEPGGHFVSLALRPQRGGAPCVGARVTAEIGARRLTRVLAGGTSYLSASDPRISIGLGPASRLDRLEVRWPSGSHSRWVNVDAGQFLEAREGSEELRPIPSSKTRYHD